MTARRHHVSLFSDVRLAHGSTWVRPRGGAVPSRTESVTSIVLRSGADAHQGGTWEAVRGTVHYSTDPRKISTRSFLLMLLYRQVTDGLGETTRLPGVMHPAKPPTGERPLRCPSSRRERTGPAREPGRTSSRARCRGRGCRAADDQLRLEEQLVVREARSGDLAHEKLDGGAAHRLDRLTHRRERGVREGHQGGVVEANKRDVPRNAEAGPSRGTNGAERHRVTRAHDPGDARLDQPHGRRLGAFERVMRLGDLIALERDPCLAGNGTRGSELAVGRLMVLRTDQDANARVAERDQVAHRLFDRDGVIARDAGEAKVLDRSVDEHRRQST